MTRQAGERDAIEAIALTAPFRRSDARDVSRRVRGAADAGQHRLVLDLTEAGAVDEGPLMLMLLGLRSELERRSCRLVVAAEDGVAQRLSTSLRLDGVIGAAPSLEEALAQVLAPSRSATTRCVDCGTRWHDRRAGPVLLVGMTCARCGGDLADGAGPVSGPG
jgi:hypothetical protein